MKCYNNFNDMFNAQVNNGARMNVFNAGAEACNLKDLVTGYDLPYVVRIITSLDDDFTVAVKDDDGGNFVLKDKIDASSPIHEELKQAGINNIIKKLNDAIDTARKAGVSIDTSEWSDTQLMNNLNKCVKLFGYGYKWDKVGTGKVDMKAKKDAEARAKKAKKDAEDKSKTKIKDGVRATGILSDNGYDTIIKFGFLHGLPYAEEYDDTGAKLDDYSLSELFSENYLNYLRSGDEDVPKITNKEFAHQIEMKFRNGDKARKIDEVYWVPGDENCSVMKTRLKSDLSLRQTRENRFAKRDEALAKRTAQEEYNKLSRVAKWFTKDPSKK